MRNKDSSVSAVCSLGAGRLKNRSLISDREKRLFSSEMCPYRLLGPLRIA